jgi:hypothetical protein
MRDATPDAASLIRAGRTEFRPDAADRERVLEALRAHLGNAALLDEPGGGELGKAAAAARISLRGAKVWGGLAALAIGTGVVVGSRVWTKAPPRVEARPAASSIRTMEPERSSSIEPSTEEGATPDTPLHVERASSTPHGTARPAPASTTSLREEVRLLSRAERQLSDGLGEDALKTLAEHERRFPKGALAEERMAARVEALCAVARRADARVALARLARAYPKSAHVDGTQRFCGDDLGVAR